MKMYCSCLLGLSLAILAGCMGTSGYKEVSLYEAASQRHHAYATGKTPATAMEWRALISEFQKVIDADVQGPSADDAQYAIASSWIWGIKVGDTEAPQQAIKAFRRLVHTYPNSEYVPLAHYWLGRCYDYIGDNHQAIIQYQLVESRYANSEVSDAAKLELARAYTQQGYDKRAETSYGGLADSSTNQKIGTTATNELQALKPHQKSAMPRSENRVQTQPQHQPNLSKRPSPPKTITVQKQPQHPPNQQFQQPKPTTPASVPKPLTPKSLTREFGLTAKTIVIDPGHGGKDPGALGSGSLQEKGVVLSISHKLREILTEKGYTVLMTRDTNRFIPLKKRTEFATQHKADLFLSIHANSTTSSKANGIETYYLNVNSKDSTSEKIAARENMNSGYSIQELETLLKGLIQESKSEDSKRLAKHVQQSLVAATGAIDRGVKHARFVVLIGTKVPAILIEAGFLTNPVEGRKLATSAYQHKIATAIAQGVDSFLGKTGESPFVSTGGPKLAAKRVEESR
ncbi:N-acetylmuramoyl-L-alanine amidase [Candidatus Poribacteria bacterium]|nr:N-acetylmuramoyl-L-alanine amidase [Candidatus Poribacteria bacterium]